MIYVLIVSQFPEFPHSKPGLPFPIWFLQLCVILCVSKPFSYQQKCQYNFHRTYLKHFSNFRVHLPVIFGSFVSKFSPPDGHCVLSNQPIADRVRFYSYIVLFRGQVDSQFQVFFASFPTLYTLSHCRLVNPPSPLVSPFPRSVFNRREDLFKLLTFTI